jgi:hypothetical protein
MAYLMDFWKMEGKSDVALKTIRLKRLANISEFIQTIPTECDLVTISRSDGQSPMCEEIWKSPRYVDLNERG